MRRIGVIVFIAVMLIVLVKVFHVSPYDLYDTDALKQAAEQGDSGAAFHLGKIYRRGDGTPKNYKEAAKWYRKAAEQGVPPAQAMLGFMYWEGQGVPKDYLQAYIWLNLALSQGIKEAKEELLKLEKMMTPEQIAEGQRLSSEWMEKHSAKP